MGMVREEMGEVRTASSLRPYESRCAAMFKVKLAEEEEEEELVLLPAIVCDRR